MSDDRPPVSWLNRGNGLAERELPLPMCTLTFVPYREQDSGYPGVRIVCNRDESRLRAQARPPELRKLAGHQALMPVDPVSDGTWIGVSDASLAAILMNVYVSQAESEPSLLPQDEPAISRGTLVPRVLAGDDLKGAIAIAETIEATRFEPFRLLLVDRQSYAEVVWAAGQFSIGKPTAIEEPCFFTSSGLGDDVVATPRRKLFEHLFDAEADWIASQDAFHRHQWPERRFASVWMTRNEARTQSITWVEINKLGIEMRYGARANESDELVMKPVRQLPPIASAG